MVRKTIDKSHKQNVKQQVNVKIHLHEDRKKKGKKGKPKRKPRPTGSNSQTNPYAQAFNPVYIQSGTPPHLEPPAPSNPLLEQIHHFVKNIKKEHIETPENSLLKTVIKKEKALQGTNEHKHEYGSVASSENEPFLRVESDSESDEDDPVSEDEEAIGDSYLKNEQEISYGSYAEAKEHKSTIKGSRDDVSSISNSGSLPNYKTAIGGSRDEISPISNSMYSRFGGLEISPGEFPSSPLSKGYYKSESSFDDEPLETGFYGAGGGIAGFGTPSNLRQSHRGRPKKYHSPAEAQAAKNAAQKRYYDNQKAIRNSVVDVNHLRKHDKEEDEF